MASTIHRNARRRRREPGGATGVGQGGVAHSAQLRRGVAGGQRRARAAGRPGAPRGSRSLEPSNRAWWRGLRPRGAEPGGRRDGERPAREPLINRLVAGLLCSPLSGLVDGTLLLLTVPGRKTGRGYTFPVQYATGPLYLWVWPGNPEAKTWWCNLRAPTVVTVRLRGQWVRGVARAIDGAVEPREAVRGLAVYGARFPRTVGHLVGGDVTDQALRDAAAETVLVRIEVDDGLLRATRRTAVPTVSGLVAGLRRRPVPT